MSQLLELLHRCSLDEDLQAYDEAAEESRSEQAAGRDAGAAEEDRRQAAVDFMEALLALLDGATNTGAAAGDPQ